MHVVLRERRLVARAAADNDHGLEARCARQNRRNGFQERRRDHDRAGAAVAQHVAVQLGHQKDIERDRNNPGADRAPERDRVINIVGQQQRDAVFLPETELLQSRREQAGARLQFAVCNCTFRIGECDFCAQTARDIGVDEIGDGVIGPALQQIVQSVSPFDGVCFYSDRFRPVPAPLRLYTVLNIMSRQRPKTGKRLNNRFMTGARPWIAAH